METGVETGRGVEVAAAMADVIGPVMSPERCELSELTPELVPVGDMLRLVDVNSTDLRSLGGGDSLCPDFTPISGEPVMPSSTAGAGPGDPDSVKG